jgi:hypothetical protein
MARRKTRDEIVREEERRLNDVARRNPGAQEKFAETARKTAKRAADIKKDLPNNGEPWNNDDIIRGANALDIEDAAENQERRADRLAEIKAGLSPVTDTDLGGELEPDGRPRKGQRLARAPESVKERAKQIRRPSRGGDER